MTDHGDFVIFNVYVPAGGGSPLTYKMKFLNALRRAMKKQREQHGKRVILVGDLNISHTEKDVFWAFLRLNINTLCSQVYEAHSKGDDQAVDSTSLPQWQIQLANSWPKIEEILKSKKVVKVQTTNPRTKEKFDKYRLAVMKNDKEVFLGGYEESPGHCEYPFDFEPAYYQCEDTGEQILAEEGNLVAIATVAELMQKLGGIEWGMELLRKIAYSHGQRSKVHPPRHWLDQILNDDDMIDTLRHFYPDAVARFTIWDQFRNRRYENQGARIDYTIVDRALLPWVQKGVESLRCPCQGRHDPNSEEAALCAATAGGRFQAVSFDGGGIIEATQATLDTQFGEKHTGIIYTPPSFSDHIAVSLLLDDACCTFDLSLEEKDKRTRMAQPHKRLQTISSFFASAPVPPNGTAATSQKEAASQNQSSAVQKKRKRTMKDFFGDLSRKPLDPNGTKN
jgi:hypothetical protein